MIGARRHGRVGELIILPGVTEGLPLPGLQDDLQGFTEASLTFGVGHAVDLIGAGKAAATNPEIEASFADVIHRGRFLGDRAAYKFWDRLSSAAKSWSCAPTNYTPVNGYCRKGGLIVDGAVVADISRGGSRRWPPGDTGIQYQLDSIQGLGLQVELLYQNGYSGAWHWQNDALRRMANIVTRSKKSGGMGWNETQASRQMPWLLDRRLGMSIPRAYSPMGRGIGFADWLWG